MRPGIVHRIDKDTSGLLVAAKTDAAHQGLAAQFEAHDLERRYLAVTWGAPDAADPRLGGPAGRRLGAGRRAADRDADRPQPVRPQAHGRGAAKAARPAVTRARVLERFGDPARPRAALVECRLETGRTHQIRVHLAYVGHPLVGDAVYGRRARAPMPALAGFPRQALHAATLGFVHPRHGAALRFEAPLPAGHRGFARLRLATERRNGRVSSIRMSVLY